MFNFGGFGNLIYSFFGCMVVSSMFKNLNLEFYNKSNTLVHLAYTFIQSHLKFGQALHFFLFVHRRCKTLPLFAPFSTSWASGTRVNAVIQSSDTHKNHGLKGQTWMLRSIARTSNYSDHSKKIVMLKKHQCARAVSTSSIWPRQVFQAAKTSQLQNV